MTTAKRKYTDERQGQLEFFDNYGIRYEDEPVLIDNTDGVYNGLLFEFKLQINDVSAVLFQAIKYLSRLRIKGESVPATILLVSLNDTKIYRFTSENYRDEIQKIYAGAASKNNKGFCAGQPDEIYDYSDMLASSKIRHLIVDKKATAEMFMPVDIDENCIVGWAERYYRENPKATKGDFLGDDTGTKVSITGEIRDPKHFKGLIRPYQGQTNEKFVYLMDCLNDRLQKKDLGAFYTPMPYARKAAELVQKAVEKVPENNDYIILDRSAGTGNLECGLIGLKDRNGDQFISHCVVSTYEYYEYKVLLERIGDQVREIIPPSEKDVAYANGKVSNADAMSKEYIDNPVIRKYVDNPNCTIILLENVPYHDESSGVTNGKVERSGKRKSYVVDQMKENIKGVATNELANQFIWSGFNYYLRQPTDSYVVFSPIKYWKQYDFFDAKPEKAFLFNRLHFHATASSISCILWSNKPSDNEDIIAEAYDINDDALQFAKNVTLKKCHYPASKNYSKVSFDNSDISTVWCAKDGTEAIEKTIRVKSYRNDNIIGYLEADSFQIAPLKRNIVVAPLYDGNGCYLTRSQYKSILPLWAAKMVPLDNWYEKDVYATTSDGGDAYTHDPEFIKSCLIYTCLSNQNKCLTFDGSDGRHYQNELCFDDGTLASSDLAKMTLNDDEQHLIELWNAVLSQAKMTSGYDATKKYGTYQITKELNTFTTVQHGASTQKVYDYPQLNTALIDLRDALKDYYTKYITPKMFQYELLK